MRIDVAICTWNRARLLDHTLASLRKLEIPADVQWRVIVVNNGCTDQTDAVITQHAADLPLEPLWEPRLGKSNALNTAIAAARGDLILWTDDDVQVDPGWLAGYVTAARRHPQAAFFGGPIDPWFETDPPAWVTGAWEEISTAFAARQFGDQPFQLDLQTLPFGANLAIRTDVQRRYEYNPRLGRVGPSEVRGEETLLLERLLVDGAVGFWVPDARVQHLIPPERLTISYLRRFFFGIGQTRALLETGSAAAARNTRGRRALLRCKAAVYETQYRVFRRIARPSVWVHKLARASHHRGRLALPGSNPEKTAPAKAA